MSCPCLIAEMEIEFKIQLPDKYIIFLTLIWGKDCNFPFLLVQSDVDFDLSLFDSVNIEVSPNNGFCQLLYISQLKWFVSFWSVHEKKRNESEIHCVVLHQFFSEYFSHRTRFILGEKRMEIAKSFISFLGINFPYKYSSDRSGFFYISGYYSW